MRPCKHMPVVLVLAALTMVSVQAAEPRAPEPIQWQPNLEAAQRIARDTNRLVLIHFWAPWCKPCLKLEKEVFSKPETFKGLETNFVMVKLNADEAPGTTRLYGVSSLPTDVITTPSGQLVSQLQSPPTVSQYVSQMNRAAVGHRSLARRPGVPTPAAPTPAPVPEPTPAPTPVPSPKSGAAIVNQQMPTAAGPATQQPVHLVAATEPPQGNDRYAEYFHQQANNDPNTNYVARAQAFAPPGAPGAGSPQMTAPPAAAPQPQAPATPYPATQPSSSQPPSTQPPSTQTPNYQQPAAQPPAAQPQYVTQQQPPGAAQPQAAPQAPRPQLPPGCPALAMDGTDPVYLLEHKDWALGNVQFGAVHRGRTYLFTSAVNRDKFLIDPDRYSPVFSGNDPVLALDRHAAVPGKREFGVFAADGHIYLFADKASLEHFEKNERQYSVRVMQAMAGTRQAQLPVQQPTTQTR